MFNIFFISNDERVTKLIERFQPFIKTKLRRASDFDHGLKELFENRPSLVCIQSHIENVSGETVARHIKSLMGTSSPKIILLVDSAISTKIPNESYDDWLPIVDSEQEFYDVFVKMLKRNLPLYRAELSTDSYNNDQYVTGCGPEAADPGEKSSVPAEDPRCNYDDNTTPFNESGAASIAIGKESPSPAKGGGVTSDNQFSPDIEFFGDPHHVGQHLHRLPHEFSWMGKKCAKRFSLFILLTLLVLAFGIFLYHSAHRENTGGGPKSSPATLQLKAGKDNTSFPRSKVVFKGLPSFVPAEGRVPAFTIANPGWERYLSPDFDFRLFRETGAIKALQVIALGDQGVPDSFLSSILKDLDFTPPKRSGKPVLKDGFLMEKSIAGGVAEIVCYRTQKHNKIVAFVVVIN